MEWPEKPTCHGGPFVSRQNYDGPFWRDPGPNAPYRTCSYCGSLHPEDLVSLLEAFGARLGGSDWKYGWPHRFYVRFPSGQMLKWYNEHLLDKGYDEAALDHLRALLHVHAGVLFLVGDDGQMRYRALYRGFQQ